MRKLIFLTLMGIVIFYSGCVRTLHPFYTEQDIVFEPSLVGRWDEDDSRQANWDFSKKGINGYELSLTDDEGKRGFFSAHLLKIEGKLFLDIFPEEPDLKENDFYQFHLLPVHTFAYVKQIEPTLQMSFPDPDWLKNHLEENPDAIQHELIENEIILTAETKELQAFWLKHLNTEDAFGEQSDMKRSKNDATEIQPDKSDVGDSN